MKEDVSAAGLVGDGQPDSLRESLAVKRREIAEKKDTFIPIAGYDKEPPLVLAHYRLLEGPELTAIGDKVRTEFRGRWDRGLHAAIDTMITACDGIYIDRGDGKPIPLTLDGNPITGYNNDLAIFLRFEDSLPPDYRHRDVLLGVFGGNELAIAEHNARLNRWFGNTSTDVSEDLMSGNS